MRLADRFRAVLLDLDGVLYRGDGAVPGAAEVVAELRAAGKRIVFLTNNS
ncbi:MAG: HAD family hydrolase, partial [Actinomycetota bacterium]